MLWAPLMLHLPTDGNLFPYRGKQQHREHRDIAKKVATLASQTAEHHPGRGAGSGRNRTAQAPHIGISMPHLGALA